MKKSNESFFEQRMTRMTRMEEKSKAEEIRVIRVIRCFKVLCSPEDVERPSAATKMCLHNEWRE